MKQCSKCKRFKELSEFHKDKTKKDGYKTICKSCRKTTFRKPLSRERKIFDRNIRLSMNRAIKNNKTGSKWEKLLGYTLKELKNHIENQFNENMNWDNFGSYWWIDHIIPKSVYNYSNVKNNEFKKCWNLKNLRPLEKKECMRKGGKIYKKLLDEYRLYDILPAGRLYLQ